MPPLTDSITIIVEVAPLLEDSTQVFVDVFQNALSDSVMIQAMVDTPLTDSVMLYVAIMGTAMENALAEPMLAPAGEFELL